METDIILATLAAIMAGFVDAIVGGGGLVQVPSLFILFPNFVVPQIIGTNRFASVFGTSVAAWQYIQKVEISYKTVFFAALGAAIASYIGATLSSMISAVILKPVVLLLMLAIAVYTFQKKNLGTEEKLKIHIGQLPVYGFIIGCCTGFYNGLVGPGTGSLLVFSFVSILGYSFLKGSAMAKLVNVIADVASLFFFLTNGYVVFKLAIPMMLGNVAGSFFGSRLAILKGNDFVRTFFLCVIFALIVRFGYDVFKVLAIGITN